MSDNSPFTEADRRFLALAIRMGYRGLGHTADTPSVGCVIVNAGRIVGRGFSTPPTGRPHAETNALRQAGDAARGATAYVSLEPCSHHGRTPPCADALIAAGITRVVAATTDPDPRVGGRGLARLREAGLAVSCGLLEAEARTLHAGFFTRLGRQRPWVTLKLASSLDGRLALANGQSQWITGEEARRFGHGLRAGHDAILIGNGTLQQDNPSLTCRLPGLEDRSPIRILLGRRDLLQPTHRLWQSAREYPVWWITDATLTPAREQRLADAGIRWFPTPDCRQLPAVLAQLATEGINRLLLECGHQLAAAFLQAGCVDELWWMQGNQLLGGDSLPAVGPLGLQALAEAPKLHALERRLLGTDSAVRYRLLPR